MSARRRRSRKRSGASFGSTRRKSRRKEPNFLIDECLGKSVAVALRGLGASARTMAEVFGVGVQDEVWLRKLADYPRVAVLTKDSRIRKRPLELQALKKGRCRCFVLVAANLSGEAQVAAFVKALPAMRRLCSKRRPPFIARVIQNGHVELI